MDERSEEINDVVRTDRITITAVVATYNEEQHIGQCLMSLLAQRGVDGEIEILVVDGMSRDRTVDIVRSFPEYGTRIRLIQNPRRLQVYAWNAALEQARGQYFAMILAHSEYGPTYFSSCLEVMRRTGAVAVGGVQRPVGSSALGHAIAWCMSTPFGMGNARFRYMTREGESDTVFSIFTRCSALRAVGGYDERIPFDEDSDLNYRLRRNGGKLVVSPRIEVLYHVRNSLRALWKQMYCYGYWRRVTQLKHPDAVPVRVYAPAALVAGLVLSVAVTATPARPLAALFAGAYAAFALFSGILSSSRLGINGFYVPLALATMHLAYGTGYWTALMKTRTLAPGAAS